MKKNLVFLRFYTLTIVLLGIVCICASENVKKSVDDDNAENDDADNMEAPAENIGDNNGTIPCVRRENSNVHEIKAAEPRQFPFVAAIMSQQNEYLCCGTVVSQRMILTTASCLQQPISHVLLNVTKDKGDTNAVLLHIDTTEKFPTFTGGETTKDVGIIYTEVHNDTFASKILVSNYTSARNVIDLTAIGFGLNADVGKTRDLQYVGVEHKPAYDIGDLLRGYFECIDTKVPTCFRDVGGPVIFDNQLYGIVTKGSEECILEMTSQYATNKVLVEILPSYVFRAWLNDRIARNEADSASANLTVYPAKPSSRNQLMALKSARNSGTNYYVPNPKLSALLIIFSVLLN